MVGVPGGGRGGAGYGMRDFPRTDGNHYSYRRIYSGTDLRANGYFNCRIYRSTDRIANSYINRRAHCRPYRYSYPISAIVDDSGGEIWRAHCGSGQGRRGAL